MPRRQPAIPRPARHGTAHRRALKPWHNTNARMPTLDNVMQWEFQRPDKSAALHPQQSADRQ